MLRLGFQVKCLEQEPLLGVLGMVTCQKQVLLQKKALVMVLANVDVNEAKRRLAESNGFVRKAIKM